MDSAPLAATAASLLAILVTAASVLSASGTAGASLERPAYAAGEKWLYVLASSLAGFPGLNASQGVAELGVTGLVEVDIAGPAQAQVGGTAVPGVRVETHASGFLNGTFAIPGNGTVHASGTFTSDTTEIWEAQSGLPTVSNSSSSYTVILTIGITFTGEADLSLNVSTSYASLPAFNLSVGESASAPYTAELSGASSVSFFGFSARNATSGSAAGVWTRQVLDEENVTVEAGTFSAYRLNQSLGSFPGLGTLVSGARTNETAWFSNDVGNYVERRAFVNGTPIAEMRLKSYTYPAAPQGLSGLDLALLIAIPVAVAVALALVLLRRRKARQAPTATGNAGPVGELPPKPPGGSP